MMARMSEDAWWKPHRDREAAFDRIVEPAHKRLAARLAAALDRAVWSGHFGATGIDPKHLFVYVVLPRRSDVAGLAGSPRWERFKHETELDLAAAGYPVASLPSTWLGCFSQQECDERHGGNWYHFFK